MTKVTYELSLNRYYGVWADDSSGVMGHYAAGYLAMCRWTHPSGNPTCRGDRTDLFASLAEFITFVKLCQDYVDFATSKTSHSPIPEPFVKEFEDEPEEER